MILSPIQTVQLCDALVDAYTPTSLEMFLSAKLDKKLAHVFMPSAAPDFPYLVFKIIDVANTEGWVLKLIHEAHKVHQHKTLLTAFVQSLPSGLQSTSALPHDPYAVTFLYGAREMCFLDRQGLRSALRALDSGAARIAAIDGSEGSGKSYSFQLILYLSEVTGRFKPVFIDLTEASGTDYGPDRLAKRIALQMSVDLPPDALLEKKAQAATWASELSDYIIGKAHAASDVWWIVLDGVLQGSLPPETLHFIHGLAQGALLASKLRVVLLSYRRELLPANVLIRSVGETIAPLQGFDLQAFFGMLLEAHGIEAEEGAVEIAVQWIADRAAPPYSGDSLAQLPALVQEAADILMS